MTALGVVWARTSIDTIGEVSFDTRLAIPPLAEPLIVGGQRIFDLRVHEGRTHLGMAKPTPTWGASTVPTWPRPSGPSGATMCG